MTREEREEAIELQKGQLNRAVGKWAQKRITHAIEALEAMPCDDAVSREAVLKKIFLAETSPIGSDNILKELSYSVENMPPVTPERKWIPIKNDSFKELPKDRRVWVTKEDEHGYRYVSDVCWDMRHFDDDVTNVIAYMDYYEPEPYKKEREEK